MLLQKDAASNITCNTWVTISIKVPFVRMQAFRETCGKLWGGADKS